MATKTSKKKKGQTAIVGFDFERLNVSIRKKEDNEGKWTNIGSSNATIDEKYLKNNPQLLKPLVGFAMNLRKQLGCDGIEIHGISFSQFNFKEK